MLAKKVEMRAIAWLHHGVDALVDFGDGVGAAELADDFEGKFHGAAGGEAGDEFAVDNDALVALNLPGGELGLNAGMADDLLFGP